MPTIKDIAKKAGVSPITVSRAVNNSGYVSEEKRRRVEEAIRELNYVPNRVASNLRSQQSDLLALILPDITNSFWTNIARGVEDAAWIRGYGVFLCNSDYDPRKESNYIESVLGRRVGGVLIVPTPDPRSEDQIERLRSHDVRVVVLHRRLRGLFADVVRTDSEAAAGALATHLVERGARRIAFVGLPFSDSGSIDRLRGFKEALHRAGIDGDPDLVRVGSLTPSTGFRLVTELLAHSPRPDGILLANSRLAVGGLRAIANAGLTIPDDIQVAAFHDSSSLDDYAPALIRAIQPSYRLGELAVERIFERARDPAQDFQEIVLQAEIRLPGDTDLGEQPGIIRESVRFGSF
jgi:LacI family transcriptional regulator